MITQDPGSHPNELDFEHKYTRRKKRHDYYGISSYHIILKKLKGAPDLSKIIGDARIEPGQPGSADVKWSDLGASIANCIYRFSSQFPAIDMYAYSVMPDHVHILLHKNRKDKYHLGYFIGHLKARICKDYSNRIGATVTSEQIFEKNYTDKIIYPWRSLNEVRNYIRQNPHRLAMRLQYPQFFTLVRRLKIGDKEYSAYGNLFLLRNPEKEAVVVRSRYTEEEYRQWKEFWIEEAEGKTVMVSPFISKREKEIRGEIERIGAPMILITHTAFGERYKPGAHLFELCSKGKLLIISLGLPEKTELTRSICKQMNALAAEIAEGKSAGEGERAR